MKRFKSVMFLAAAALLLTASTATSDSRHLCEGFLPPNDMKIPVGTVHRGFTAGSGITEQEFNAVMDRIESIYTTIVSAKGATLKVNRLWNDATVNASAQQIGNQWIINMYGGLARHSDITVEGMALVACHEIGHHLGGAPKIQSIFGGAWASNEGGSDYYATLKCLRTYFGMDDNGTIVRNAAIDPTAAKACEAQFTNQTDIDICKRNSMAGESVAFLFQDLRKDSAKPNYSTPDTSQVNTTNDKHPATQCRMDTYFAGMLCPVAVSVPNSDTDYKAGSCVEGQDAVGYRSRCWFNPNSGGGGGGGGGGGEACPIDDEELCKQLCTFDPTMPWCKK